MTIKQQGGIFGRNPTFNDVTVQGDVEVDGQLGVKTSSHWDSATAITAAGRVHVSDGTATGGFNYGNGTVINMGSMSAHPVQMIVGNSTKAIFETDGDLKLVSGNLIINTSGKGIDFSATSGTGTSELFDDYEEGTFSVDASDGTNTDSGSANGGAYTKIGNIVHASGYIRDIDTTGMTSGNNLRITGLPYTSTSTSYIQGFGGVKAVSITSANGAVFEVAENSTYGLLRVGSTPITISNVGDDAGDVYFKVSYPV